MSVEERLDRLETKVEGIAADVEVLKTDVAVLKTDVAVLKTDVKDLKTGMTTLTAAVAALPDIMARQLVELRVQLSRDIAGVAASQESAQLRMRVDRLEDRVGTLERKS